MGHTEYEFLPGFQGVYGKRCFNDQLAPPDVVSYAVGITDHSGGDGLVVVQIRAWESGSASRFYQAA